MKNVLLFVLILAASLLAGCAKSQTMSQKKILIVYLTRTKNTKAVAEIIQKNTGGTLAAIEPATPYPEDYKAQVQQVVDENEKGYLPPLKTKIDSIETYNVVFVGFPTWDMKMPPPVKSFLHQYNFSGKTIVPFNSNAGYGVGNGFETVKELCPNSTVLKAYSTKGGIEKDGVLFVMKGDKLIKVRSEVKKWLQEIKLVN